MEELIYNIWITIKWFFGEFCIQLITAPIGLLKDVFDTIKLSWKAIGIIACVLGLIITIVIKWILKDR